MKQSHDYRRGVFTSIAALVALTGHGQEQVADSLLQRNLDEVTVEATTQHTSAGSTTYLPDRDTDVMDVSLI